MGLLRLGTLPKILARTFLGLALVVLAVAAAPPDAAAQAGLFFDAFGAGTRAAAMAQAYTAIADDPSAAYYNPAGLVQMRSPFLCLLGWHHAGPDVRARIAGDPAEGRLSEDRASGGPLLGVVSHFGSVERLAEFPAWFRRIAVGMIFFVNVPEVNQFNNPQRRQDPYFLKHNARWSLLNVAVSAAFPIADWLSVGAGIMPAVASFQDSRESLVAANEAFNPASKDPTRGFHMNLRQQAKVSAVPVAGILVRPPIGRLKEKVSIGFSYRGEMAGFYGTGPTQLDVVLEHPDGSTELLVPTPEGRIIDYTGFNPEQMTLGLGVEPLRGLIVALDVTWKDTSEFRFFWDLPPEPKFHDVVVSRGALEYALAPAFSRRGLRKIETIAFRAGYAFEPSPVPTMDGVMNILDSDQHVFSAGLGFDTRPRGMKGLRIDLALQLHVFEGKRIENDDDPLYGPIKFDGEVYSGGVSMTVEF